MLIIEKSIEIDCGLLSKNERCEETEQYDLFHNKIFCAFKLSIKIVKLDLCFKKVFIFQFNSVVASKTKKPSENSDGFNSKSNSYKIDVKNYFLITLKVFTLSSVWILKK